MLFIIPYPMQYSHTIYSVYKYMSTTFYDISR